MPPPAVSVLLPVYNGAAYLRQSLQSVLAQSWPDFELLVCDDASSDGSADLLTECRDPRVRLSRHTRNLGLFATLNELVGAARAPLVRLWAQDDVMKPACLAREQRFWAEHPGLGLSYCAYDIIDGAGRHVRTVTDGAMPPVLEPWRATQLLFHWGCITSNISTVTVRRSVFDAVGPFAPLRVSGDFEMWARVARAYPFGFLNEPLIDLRLHRRQLSAAVSSTLAFIRENRPIYEDLAGRLPPPLRPRAAAHRRWRSMQYFHAGLRAFLAGHFATGRAILTEVARDNHPVSAALLWLLTVNGRRGRPASDLLPPAKAAPATAGGGARSAVAATPCAGNPS